MHPPIHDVREAVARALAEDLQPLGDITAALLPVGTTATAKFVSRQPGRIAGVLCADEALRQVDEDLARDWAVAEGAIVEAGHLLGTVSGSLASILAAERTALNFMCHLSGIASRVGEWVALTDGRIQIWDTRKTTPGLRSLEKAAVRAGGGANHRGNLSDWVMFKDNHLTVLGVTEAVKRARQVWPARTVHVECDRLDQMVEAIEIGADVVLLDNMSPEQVVECVAVANDARAATNTRVLVEISGGVNDDNIVAYANTGADLVSSGSLTNSSANLDIGLDIDSDPASGSHE